MTVVTGLVSKIDGSMMTPIGSIDKIGGMIHANMTDQMIIVIHKSFFEGKNIFFLLFLK